MKRSASINLERMRKRPRINGLKPLTVAVAAAMLVACGQTREAKLFKSVEQCTDANPGLDNQCKAAYQHAQEEALRTGPKYHSKSDCEAEFGDGRCERHISGYSFFMPAMAGFMFAKALPRDEEYQNQGYASSPLFTSYRYRSPMYGRWTTASGETIASTGTRSVRVSNSAFTPQPSVVRTISRGGFGSTVNAKASFGGSSFRGGWGG